MIFPQIQGGHGLADSSAAALNLWEKTGALEKERRALLGQSCVLAVRAGRGPERSGYIPVAAAGDWATGMSPFRLA